MQSSSTESSRALLARQRSHLLLVLSHPRAEREAAFRVWYAGAYRQAVERTTAVLSVRQYAQHVRDVTAGRWPRLPFAYLSLNELSIDGAEAAVGVIERIVQLHEDGMLAQPPATWLYYASSEKVGRAPGVSSSLLTVAFANGRPGREDEFREWYATRHIRHAMQISALVSGQCFERTQFQRAGALEARFSTIAIYEQEGSVDSMMEDFARIPPGSLDFPSLDLEGSRFSESWYCPI